MSVDVIVPWQGDCEYRLAARQFIMWKWGELGFNVILGVLEPDRPWCKARAVGNALKESTAEVIVVTDADVWDPWVIDGIDAVETIERCRWAVPHRLIRRLDQASSAAVIAGGPFQGRVVQEKRSVPGGGLVVLEREMYDACPLDTRFEGWGCEDESWGIALNGLFGEAWRKTSVGRGAAPIWHLWHPPAPRRHAMGSDPSRELRNRYLIARNDRSDKVGKIKAILAEMPSV